MDKNIRNAFFLVTSNIGTEQEQFISTVGNLCPETNVVAVNSMNLNRPGIFANTWNVNKATFLITAQSDDVIGSILRKLENVTRLENLHTIKVDRGRKRI